jgi:hypothetical protein
MKKQFDLYEFLHNNKVKKSNNVPITENTVFKGYNDVRRSSINEVQLVDGKLKLGNKLIEVNQIELDNSDKPINTDKVKAIRSEKLPVEIKRHFLEIISTYNAYQTQMNRPSEITEVAETLGAIVEAAKELAITEAGDWFDKVTIKRNMTELEKLGHKFEKFAVEARDMDNRLHALYEDMGHILNRYYEISDIDPAVMRNRLALKTERKRSVNENLLSNIFKKLSKYFKEDDDTVLPRTTLQKIMHTVMDDLKSRYPEYDEKLSRVTSTLIILIHRGSIRNIRDLRENIKKEFNK